MRLEHLAIDDIPRRPLHAPEKLLGDRLAGVAELDDTDLDSLLNILDALVAKKASAPSSAATPAEARRRYMAIPNNVAPRLAPSP